MQLPFEFEKLTDDLGQGFDYLEISNQKPLGVIDNDFSTAISSTTELILGKNEIIEDDSYNDYSIHVYHLNKNSRKGNAFVRTKENKDVMDSPRFTIEGEDSLDNSIFTESLHVNKYIIVSAKAKKLKDRIKFLTIRPE